MINTVIYEACHYCNTVFCLIRTPKIQTIAFLRKASFQKFWTKICGLSPKIATYANPDFKYSFVIDKKYFTSFKEGLDSKIKENELKINSICL